jgi:branched-subunit amino acid transport protein
MTTTAAWTLIGLCAVVTAAIKAAGPVTLGGRELPAWFDEIVKLLAPALLAALVCASALADGDRLAVGADTVGVAVAGAMLWRGASVVTGVTVAAAATALLRAL